MSGWMIVLLVLAILLAIGLIPVGVDAGYGADGYFVKIKIWLLRVTLLPQREKKAKPKKQKKTKKSIDQQEKPAEEGTEKKKFSIPGGIDGIFAIARFAADVLGDLRRKLRVETLYLRVIFGGGEDAAKAAIGYGRAWAVIGALDPMLDRFLVIRNKDMQPELRYEQQGMTAEARLILTITIGRALSLALRAGVGALKLISELKKGGATNESSSV